ncbi:MAG TPA: RlpA-like double-psi beta-barrel domain-containing protein, partial [Acetobacteraceae bacterium]|nr:RlpA-like double-psi beta-barrel domain-containing protein [Acetobacteraceae bacterium]
MRWLLLALALGGCVQRAPAPAPRPHYVVGPGYEAGGAWFYPREELGYDATGLAERVADRTGLTADGERFDPSAMAGAHQTLQLPAIARVTNLENGRQVVIRLNDRGPANPGRVLGLTRRAADLLGVPATGAARVRVQVENAPSQALRDRLAGGPQGITAAPRGAVAAENLPPPPGVTQSGRGRVAGVLQAAAADSVPESEVPDRLPEQVEQVAANPGQLWIMAGQFGQPTYANAVRSKLYGMTTTVERVPGTRPPAYRVIAGPFASVAEADAALDRARAAGVTDAKIVV